MPQNVQPFEFSDPAKQLRAFVYEFWCEHGHGPNLRAAHDGTGLTQRPTGHDRRAAASGTRPVRRRLGVALNDRDGVH